MTIYPETPAARDRWILRHRPARNRLDPGKPYAFLVEEEPGRDGSSVEVVTIFLTNRECPWRCLMCDLWRNTLEETAPRGSIVEQIRFALGQLPRVSSNAYLKLYNAGSFFDPRAIPPSDFGEIAGACEPFERVIVESHPALIGDRCLEFRDRISGQLEVAMGLETVHPQVLERLNKRMTLDDFQDAAATLRREAVDLRVFILVRPPWLSESEGLDWARKSLDFAFDCGASVCSLIPTRAGNGAMDALRTSGEFSPPRLSSLESAQEYGLNLRRGRVFADLWDAESFADCSLCSPRRIDRIRGMNHSQVASPTIECPLCNPEL